MGHAHVSVYNLCFDKHDTKQMNATAFKQLSDRFVPKDWDPTIVSPSSMALPQTPEEGQRRLTENGRSLEKHYALVVAACVFISVCSSLPAAAAVALGAAAVFCVCTDYCGMGAKFKADPTTCYAVAVLYVFAVATLTRALSLAFIGAFLGSLLCFVHAFLHTPQVTFAAL